MKIVAGVLAEPPIAGTCKKALYAAYGAEWIAGFYAAVLRDVLDGVQAIAAEEYVVFAAGAHDVLRRHVPVPWKIVAEPESADRGARIVHALEALLARQQDARALLLCADAPSFEPSALETVAAAEAFAFAPTEAGDIWAVGATKLETEPFRDVPWATRAAVETIRVRCKEAAIAFSEGGSAYAVDEPSDVLRLLDELRSHPDRAPRSAQYLVTHS